MALSLQLRSVAPFKVEQGTRRELLSCCTASQLGILVRRSPMRVVRCRVVEEGGEASHTNSPVKDGASASWLHADSASDPFLGWTADNSQHNHSTKAGWIKIGGALVLGIGFALGACTLYLRQEAGQTTVAPVAVSEQTITSSEASKPSEVQGGVEQNDIQTDPHNSEQERQLEIDGAVPNVKQEVSPSANLPKILGRILVPASVDHMQEQFLAALQALKVIEAGVEPGDLCTRRDYARWLIAASARLSRSPGQKVFPAMYIENVSRLAYDDVSPEDQDFSCIQGLAEAGMIYSRLEGDDTEQADDFAAVFSPDSPLTRQDLITWKRALERKPPLLAGDSSSVSEKALEELSGFIDIKKIHKDARPALLEDMKAGDRSIVALAFGYTRRFQPLKPVTKAQAAAALATGEAWELVSEELARLEADTIAEAAIAAEFALETKAQQEVAAAFNELLQGEREKQKETASLVEKLQAELEQLKMEREEEKYALLKDRAALDAERDSLLSMRHEVEQQALLVSSAKLEVSFRREQVDKLHAEAESERASIGKIRTELDVEKNALSSARAWAEQEARRALAHSKLLEQARKRWEYQGVEVRVGKELDEENIPGLSWQYSEDFHSQSSPTGMLVAKSKDLAQVVKDTVLRFVHFVRHICQGLLARSKDLAWVVKDAILRFVHFVQLKFQAIKQWSTELAENSERVFKDASPRFVHFVRIKFQAIKQQSTKLAENLKQVVKDAFARFLHFMLLICQAIKQQSTDLAENSKRVVKDAFARFLHFILLVCQAIKQRSTELAGKASKKFHEAKTKCADSTGNTMEGIKRALPSSATEMTASIKEGTLKAVAECRGGAERLAQKLKVS